MSESTLTQTILVRYREKGGDLKFEYITGTNVEIEAQLKGYLSTKDPHSLLVLGSTSSITEIDVNLGLTISTEFGDDILVTEALHHWLIHQGKIHLHSDVDTDVDMATPKYWHIMTPDEESIHLTTELKSTVAGLVELFEEGEVSASGTLIEGINVNRANEDTCPAHLYRDPTVTQDGDRIFQTRVGTQSSSRVGGEVSQGQFILKANTVYLIKFTSDANNAVVSLILEMMHEEIVAE